MNILICIKQVPDAEGVGKDPETNGIVLDGVPEILNPYDGYALEAAARLKDKAPDTTLSVLTVGPEKDKAALKDCLGIAADKGFRVNADGSSDALSMSAVLAAAVRKLEETEGRFDAIFCGRQTTDWESAQVPGMLAERLGYPQLTGCFECEADGDGLKVTQQAESGKLVESIPFPCVLSFTQPGYDPRFPSIKRKMMANKAVIPVLSLAELGDGAQAADVLTTLKTAVPAKRAGGLIVKEESLEETTAKLASLLSEAHVI